MAEITGAIVGQTQSARSSYFERTENEIFVNFGYHSLKVCENSFPDIGQVFFLTAERQDQSRTFIVIFTMCKLM